MQNNQYEAFKKYLEERHLRMTKERKMIFGQICSFPKHFDVAMLGEKMELQNYHVSVTTLYNLLDLLVRGGIIVRHQWNTLHVEYEMAYKAQTHCHLVCLKCGAVREIKRQSLDQAIQQIKPARFTTEYVSLYIYGVCAKCKSRMLQAESKE